MELTSNEKAELDSINSRMYLKLGTPNGKTMGLESASYYMGGV